MQIPWMFFCDLGKIILKCASCTNRQKFTKKTRQGFEKGKKVIHNFKSRKPEKSSYTLSYTRYPQKQSIFLQLKSW